MNAKQRIKEEIEVFKTGMQIFDPDPEYGYPYFTIFKDGKQYGRSNRQVALDRFLANVCAAPENERSGFTVVFDDEPNIVHEVSDSGKLKAGHSFIDRFYLSYILNKTI